MNFKKIAIFSVTSVMILAAFTACSSATPPEKNDDNSYYTEFCMSELEYKMYANEKIALATEQLVTHMSKVRNVAKGEYSPENEAIDIEFSISLLKEARQNINYAYPPDVYAKTREVLLKRFQDIIDCLDKVNKELEKGSLTTEQADKYANEMENIYTSIVSLNT